MSEAAENKGKPQQHDADGLHHCTGCGKPLSRDVLAEQARALLAPFAGLSLDDETKAAIQSKMQRHAGPFWNGADICFRCGPSARLRRRWFRRAVSLRWPSRRAGI